MKAAKKQKQPENVQQTGHTGVHDAADVCSKLNSLKIPIVETHDGSEGRSSDEGQEEKT